MSVQPDRLSRVIISEAAMQIFRSVVISLIVGTAVCCPRPALALHRVVLPHLGGADTVTVSHVWQHRSVDVGIIFDCTGSMGGELQNLKTSFSSIIAPTLVSYGYTDLRFGVAEFEDWPCGVYGAPSDLPFALRTRCTSSMSTAQSHLNALTIKGGNDESEAGWEAIHQALTGAGGSAASCASTSIPAFLPSMGYQPGVADGNGGGMGFRDDGRATSVLCLTTDAPFHDSTDYTFSGPVGRARTLAELRTKGYRIAMLLSSTSDSAKAQLRQLSQTSGTVIPAAYGTDTAGCETGLAGASEPPVSGGCPDVFLVSGNGSGYGSSFVQAVQTALDASPFTLTRALRGVAVDGGHTSDEFVQSVRFTAASNPSFAPPPTLSSDSSRVSGSFAQGAFDLALILRNDLVEQGMSAQEFAVFVDVMAGGTVMATDTLVVEVPIAGAVTPEHPGGFALSEVEPNPSRGSCRVALRVPATGRVELDIWDAAGRHVRSLAQQILPAGTHAFLWDGATGVGRPAPAGLYFLRASWQGRQTIRRLVRLR
jgi:hypothetical protein